MIVHKQVLHHTGQVKNVLPLNLCSGDRIGVGTFFRFGKALA